MRSGGDGSVFGCRIEGLWRQRVLCGIGNSEQTDNLRNEHSMNWIKGILLAAVATLIALALSGCAP